MFFHEKKGQQNLRKDPIQSDENLNKNESSNEEMYKNAFRRRRRESAKKILIFGMIQILILCFLVEGNNKLDLQKRAIRELENQIRGEISLSTGVYTGNTDFGYFFGNGEFKFETGAVYTGTWENNQISGVGKIKKPGEGVYEGDFKNAMKSGRGTFRWEDGSVYEGEWSHDRMSGEGMYTGANGLICEGIFSDNMLYTGLCSYSDQTGEFHVNFRDGKAETVEINP